MEEPILRTKRFKGHFFSLFFFILVYVAVSVFFVTLAAYDHGDWLGIIKLIIPAISPICIPIMLIILIRYNLYQLYDDRVQVISFLGFNKGSFLLKDIVTWTERERSVKEGTFYVLILYTADSRYRISSAVTGEKDYTKIKAILTSGIKEDLPIKRTRTFNIRRARVIIFVMCFLIAINLLGAVKYYCTNLNDLKNGDFSSRQVVLSKEPLLDYHNKGNGSLLRLYFDDNKDSISFSGYTFYAINSRNFADSVTTRDTVFVDKVRDKPSNMIMRVFGSINDHYCGLRTRKSTYLNFFTFIATRRDENIGSIYTRVFFLVCFLLVIGYNTLRIVNNKMKQKEPGNG